MKSISNKVESEVIKSLLSGDSYRKISRECSISTSTVHKIVQNLRNKVFDFDELRCHVVKLRKLGLTMYDVARMNLVADQLNSIGVSVDQITDFCRLVLQISSTHDLTTADLVESSIKLMHLKQQTGKSSIEIVDEFKETIEKTQELKEEEANLRSEIMNSKEELTEIRTKQTNTTNELNSLVKTNNCVNEIGLKKISLLAKFIEEVESTGINVKEVARAIRHRRELEKNGIAYEDLEKYLKNVVPLKKQISNLRKKKQYLENAISKQESTLQNLALENNTINYCKQILTKKTITTTCWNCKAELILPANQELYRQMIEQKQSIMVLCIKCGCRNEFNLQGIIYNLGWHILPIKGQIV